MAKQNTVQINVAGLDGISKAWNTSLYTKVGVVGQGAARQGEEKDSLNNAELGVIHEFGTMDGRIPARSWLRFPIEYKARDILSFLKTPKIKKYIAEGKIRNVFDELGKIAEIIIDSSFVTSGFGSWKPNAQSTIDEKGSSKPLIDTSQLRRSVTHEVVKGKP